MAKTGVVLMTALVPTTGHEFLIRFASHFMNETFSKVHVIVSSRSKEPIPGSIRARVLDHVDLSNIEVHLHQDDNAPQNPRSYNDTEFWEYWKNTVLSFTKEPVDVVFASELYGARLAEFLECEFIPVDIARETVPISGTQVRKDLFHNVDHISKEFVPYLKSTVVLFGQESTGKSTLGRALAKRNNGVYLAEWARPYLETVGHESTPERMLNIVRGQYAFMKAAEEENKLITFRDTDLYSTANFYKSWNMEIPEILYDYMDETRGDLYLVTNDNIPFEKDILRYGGDVRETTREFWIDFLDEHDLPYYLIKSNTPEERIIECEEVIFNTLPGRNGITYSAIKNFKRE